MKERSSAHPGEYDCKFMARNPYILVGAYRGVARLLFYIAFLL
jgi:hypothetical protein